MALGKGCTNKVSHPKGAQYFDSAANYSSLIYNIDYAVRAYLILPLFNKDDSEKLSHRIQ